MIDRMTLRGCLVLLVALTGSTALACGPFFPWQLLDDRSQTLHDLPVDSFAFGATRLVSKPALRLPPPQPSSWVSGKDLPTAASEEHKALPASEMAVVATMRRQATAEAAEAAGNALPDGIRLYVAGAIAFNHGDCAGAADRFHRALALPAPFEADGTLWASFMLGRALASCTDDAAAADAFQNVRRLVDAGAADPLELALASFGEEARLSLKASGLPMDDATGGDRNGSKVATDAVARLHQAVMLYGEQAAFGDGSGTNSLQLVAEALLSDKPNAFAWLAAAVQDPLLRHLVALYALSATGPAPQEVLEATGRDVLSYEGPLFSNLAPVRFEARVLEQMFAATAKAGSLDWQDAGRLAALAYLNGSYDLARHFAAGEPGPLAAWIRAKLVLQAGDLQATGRAFGLAVQELAAHPEVMTVEAAGRIRAEDGVVALARGDFQEAMAILYPLGDDYWGDVAYLAERVFTIDELRRFVVASVPPVRLLPEQDASADTAQSDAWNIARSLRELLARRLMRDGRWTDAGAAFTRAEERREAAAYADDLARSHHAFWRTDRARAAWDAALIARQHGLELFGTELDPDQDAVGARFDQAYGPSHAPSGSLVTVNERWRYAGSSPVPDHRFHYRFLAAGNAERAADALPGRSQAFAAVLCRAASWMFQSDDEAEAFRLYKCYTAFGAIVPFATRFGYGCPAPDFDAAARLRWTEPVTRAASMLQRHRRPLAAAGVVLAVLLGTATLVRRRHGRA